MPVSAFERQPDTSYFDVVDDPNTAALPEEAQRKASMLSAVSDFDNPLAREFLIKQELLSSGQSPTAEQELSAFKSQQVEGLTSDALMTLSEQDLSPEERLGRLKSIAEEEATNPSIRRVFIEKAAVQANASESAHAEDHQLTLSEHLDDIESATDQVAKFRNIINYDDNTEVDFVLSTLLPGFALQYKEIIDQVDPNILGATDYVLAGEAKLKFQEWFAKQTPEVKVETLRKVATAINDNRFFGMDNNIVTADLMQGLFDNINEPSQLDRILLDTFGVIDTIGFALLGKGGYKAAVKLLRPKKTMTELQRMALNYQERIRRGSVADTAAQTAPEDTRKALDAAVADESGELARVLGTHRDNIVDETILPKMPDDPVRPMPDLNDGSGLDLDTSLINATSREIDASMSDLEIKLQSIADTQPHVHLSKSRVDIIPGGYEMEYYAGQSPSRGFSSIKIAQAIIKMFRGVRHGSEVAARILGRQFDTGEYVPLEELRKPPTTRLVEEEVEVTEEVVKPTPSIATRIAALEQGGDILKADILRSLKQSNQLSKDYEQIIKDVAEASGFDVRNLDEFLSSDEGIQVNNKVVQAINELNQGGIIRSDPDKYGIFEFVTSTTEKISKKTKVSKEVKIPKEELPKGDYIIQFRARHYINPNDALDEVTTRDNSIVTSFLGKYAHFLDKDSYLADWISKAGNHLEDLSQRKQKTLRRILKPLTDLNIKTQRKVYAVLEEGEQQKTWFTPGQIGVIVGDDKDFEKIARGYYAVVRFQREAHKLLNTSVRKTLIGEQQKHIIFKRGFKLGENQAFGKVTQSLKDIDPKTTLFWNAAEGKFKTMNRTELSEYIDKGGQVVHLRRPMRKDSTDFRYALYDPKDAGGIGIREIPNVVVRDIPGYITRIYDVTHIVRKKILTRTDKGGPPEPKYIPIGMTSNKVDADALKVQLEEAALAAGEEAPEIVVTRSRELSFEDQQYANRTSIDFLYDTGQLFFSTRGQEIFGLDGKRQLKSIADSLTAMLTKASRVGTVEPLVQKLKRNWEARFGNLFVTENGEMPWFGDLVRRLDVPTQDELVSEANAFRNHIKMLAGIDQPRLLQGAKELMVSWIDNISTTSPSPMVRSLANVALRNIDRDPFNAVKAFHFIRLIVLNPIRQLMLQSRQMSVYLGVDYGFKYFMSGTGMRDYFGLLAGTMYRHMDSWNSIKKAMAPRVGMSEKEYEEFVDAYMNSGFHDSVDSHLWTQMVALDRNPIQSNTKLMSAMYGTKNAFTVPIRWLRRIGFDAGERFQLIGAFLAARNKFMKTNPKLAKDWMKPEYLAKIGGEARQLAFNMNRAGTLGHQKGILGVMFQFMSHTTKSLQFLIPQDIKIIPGYKKTLGKLANKAISDREKARIAGIQFGMYGTGGLGLTKAAEEVFAEVEQSTGVEIPKGIKRLTREGLEGTAFNIAINAATGTDSDFEYSKALSPFGGSMPWQLQNPVARMVDWTFNTNVPFTEMLGPTYSYITRDVPRAWETASMILGDELLPLDTSTPEKALEVLNVAVRNFVPLYNNLMKSRAELAIGRYISLAGNEGVQATSAEILSKAILGVGSVKSRQIGDEYRRLAGVKGLERIPAEWAEIADHSRMVYSITKQYLQESSDKKITPEEMYNAIYQQAVLNRELLTPDEYDYVFNKRIPELMRNDFDEDSMEMKLVKLIVDTYGEGPADPFDHTLEQIRNWQPFEGQQELLQALERFREIESQR